jgi:hypothetical protein
MDSAGFLQLKSHPHDQLHQHPVDNTGLAIMFKFITLKMMKDFYRP